MSSSEKWAKRWMALTHEAIGENREVLIELDRQIGDGDHGENLDRGFNAVVKSPAFLTASTGAEVFKHVAKSLMSTVGGAAGPLYGTAFLRAAAKMPDGEVGATDVVAVLESAVEGIQARGKAVAGDKTMVDAWLPAVEAARVVAAGGGDALAAVLAAAEAADRGAEATKPMKALKGRASYLGERSIGHLDPGAVSSALILQAAAQAAQEELS